MTKPARVAHIHVGPLGKIPWFPFESLVGVLAIILGVYRLLKPGSQSVPPAPDWASTTVTVSYLLAGVCMLLGLARLWVRVEMFGLLALALAFATSTALKVVFNDAEGVRDLFILAAVCMAAGTRLYELLKGRVVLQIEIEKAGE